MSEGTALTIVAKAIWDATPTLVRFDEAQEWRKQEAFRQAYAVLAALTSAGALAPAGLTERAKRIEREANAAVDAVSLLLAYKQDNGYCDETEMDLAIHAERALDGLHEALEAADAAPGEPS